MKRILFVLIIIGGFTKAEAQSMLRVHVTDNTPVNVELDGRYFNKRGTGVTVGDLPPGKHRLKIYAMNQGRRGRGYEDVIYEGKIFTENGMVTLLEYDPSTGGISTEEQDINSYTSSKPRLNAQIQARQNQNNNAYNDNGGNNNADNNNGDAGNNNMNNGGYSAPAAPVATGTLTDTKISDLKAKVDAVSTDTKKTNLLEDGLQGETMTTGQVATMIDFFGFESSKVDFAEWAYNYTVDKEYFGDLESKFTYKEYQDALDKFLKSK